MEKTKRIDYIQQILEYVEANTDLFYDIVKELSIKEDELDEVVESIILDVE